MDNLYTLNEEKYKAVILYLIKNISNGSVWGKKKMYKLLYYADFDFFEKYERPITGDIYHKLQMGPAPSYFDAIVAQLAEEGKLTIGTVKNSGGYNDTVTYKVEDDPEIKGLSSEEIEILDRVIRLYGDKTGRQLETLTHKESPYLAVDEGEEMPLELAHYRGTQF